MVAAPRGRAALLAAVLLLALAGCEAATCTKGELASTTTYVLCL